MYFLMTLLIKNDTCVFLIRLDLMFSLWKELQLLQILNDLSIKHLIKLILHENYVKLLKLKEVLYRSISDIFEVWDFGIDTWKKYIKKYDGMVNLFFYTKFNVRILII